MVEIKVIPPNASPVIQTAYYKNKNLQEQMLSFLNNNNSGGFIQTDNNIRIIEKIPLLAIKKLDNLTIVDICLLLTQHDYIQHKSFKEFARLIKLLSSKKIKHGHALDILSKLFGYYTHSGVTAFLEKTNTDMVRNLRYMDNKSRVQVLSGEKFIRPSVTEKDILNRNK